MIKRFEKEANRNSRTEKYKAKIMSSPNGYRAVQTQLKRISVKWKVNQKKILQNEEQRVKWIENIEVKIRKKKKKVPNRRFKIQ